MACIGCAIQDNVDGYAGDVMFLSCSFTTYEGLLDFLKDNPASQFSVQMLSDEEGELWFYSTPDPDAALARY
jgi:hypothetical protein